MMVRGVQGFVEFGKDMTARASEMVPPYNLAKRENQPSRVLRIFHDVSQ